jgi:hypothetical protein
MVLNDENHPDNICESARWAAAEDDEGGNPREGIGEIKCRQLKKSRLMTIVQL